MNEFIFKNPETMCKQLGLNINFYKRDLKENDILINII